MVRLKQKVIIVLTVIVLLLTIGFISEKLRRDTADKYSPPGDFTEDQHTKMHYITKGTGDQTVVFSSGNGTASPHSDMFHLQEEISEKAETIIYERPGYGWSDATSKPRSIDTITDEIEQVLDEGSDNKSFIFVGHSMASLEILSYTHRYPENVDGIVLIDGVHPQYASEMASSTPASIHLTKALKHTGILRLVSHFSFVEDNLIQGEHLPDSIKEEDLAFILDRMWEKTMLQERKMIPENGKQIQKEGDLGSIPLIIFSSSENPMEGWKSSQETLPVMSENAKQIWIDTDDLFIHHQEHERIVDEIKELLE